MVFQIRSMHFLYASACAVLLPLVAMHAAHADTIVYKFTGPNGVTVYTQVPAGKSSARIGDDDHHQDPAGRTAARSNQDAGCDAARKRCRHRETAFET